MNSETEYRDVGFSIGENGDGTWRWKLHPPKTGTMKLASLGQSGSRDEAIEAARRAIDTLLDRKSN